MNDEQKVNITGTSDPANSGDFAVEPDTFAPVSDEVKALAEKALAKLRAGSYSERHPELGKMINCPACDQRHRAHKGCSQSFVYLFTEQELDEDEHVLNTTEVGRTAFRPDLGKKPTAKQFLGAQRFKGKRKKSHLSWFKLLFVEEVRRLIGAAELNLETEEDKNLLKEVRVTARRNIMKRLRADRKKKMRQSDVSRRINHGNLRHGYQVRRTS